MYTAQHSTAQPTHTTLRIRKQVLGKGHDANVGRKKGIGRPIIRMSQSRHRLHPSSKIGRCDLFIFQASKASRKAFFISSSVERVLRHLIVSPSMTSLRGLSGSRSCGVCLVCPSTVAAIPPSLRKMAWSKVRVLRNSETGKSFSSLPHPILHQLVKSSRFCLVKRPTTPLPPTPTRALPSLRARQSLARPKQSTGVEDVSVF